MLACHLCLKVPQRVWMKFGSQKQWERVVIGELKGAEWRKIFHKSQGSHVRCSATKVFTSVQLAQAFSTSSFDYDLHLYDLIQVR